MWCNLNKGRAAPDLKREVQNEASEVFGSVAVSQLTPCLEAGQAELKLGSLL
jgi:hypothetical protein